MNIMIRQFLCGALLLAMPLAGVAPADDCAEDGPYFLATWSSTHGLGGDWFGDPDGDGVANYVEFGFGTDPMSASTGQGMDYVQPSIRFNVRGEAEIVILQPNFPCGGNEYGRHWFWIMVAESTDLENWRVIATKPGAGGGIYSMNGNTVTATKRAAGDWEVVIRDRQAAQGRKWYRLEFYIVS